MVLSPLYYILLSSFLLSKFPGLYSTDVDLTGKTQTESEAEEAKSKQDLEAFTG